MLPSPASDWMRTSPVAQSEAANGAQYANVVFGHAELDVLHDRGQLVRCRSGAKLGRVDTSVHAAAIVERHLHLDARTQIVVAVEDGAGRERAQFETGRRIEPRVATRQAELGQPRPARFFELVIGRIAHGPGSLDLPV